MVSLADSLVAELLFGGCMWVNQWRRCKPVTPSVISMQSAGRVMSRITRYPGAVLHQHVFKISFGHELRAGRMFGGVLIRFGHNNVELISVGAAHQKIGSQRRQQQDQLVSRRNRQTAFRHGTPSLLYLHDHVVRLLVGADAEQPNYIVAFGHRHHDGSFTHEFVLDRFIVGLSSTPGERPPSLCSSVGISGSGASMQTLGGTSSAGCVGSVSWRRLGGGTQQYFRWLDAVGRSRQHAFQRAGLFLVPPRRGS